MATFAAATAITRSASLTHPAAGRPGAITAGVDDAGAQLKLVDAADRLSQEDPSLSFFFDDSGTLHGVATSDKSAALLSSNGVVVDRRSRGEKDLRRIRDETMKGFPPKSVDSASIDLRSDRVYVELRPGMALPTATKRDLGENGVIVTIAGKDDLVPLYAGSQPFGTNQNSRSVDYGWDYGLIDFDSTVATPPRVANRTGGYITVTRQNVGPYAGQSICKYGSTTGFTCGIVQDTHAAVTYNRNKPNKVFLPDIVESTMCNTPGDSGGPITTGSGAVGVMSGGRLGDACRYNSGKADAPDGAGYFQTTAQAEAWYGVRVKTG